QCISQPVIFAGQINMSMKKHFILLFVTFLSVNSFSSSLTLDVIYNERFLNLFAENPMPQARSTFQPIELYIDDEGDLRAQFNKDQGEILIRITDNTNTPMYESIVNTSFEKETYIPASTLPAGTYTIYFIIEEDYYWYAEFDL
ncbi:MAG: DUF3244 domain-containing protein, partial [Bacteroides sp.]|nr:DUF3244 domain-containing protein [Bacteroides sp.]